jgi:hypothetical protein
MPRRSKESKEFTETITKVKWKGKPGEFSELSIGYTTEVEKGGAVVHCELPGYEAPHPDFFIALDKFIGIVIASVHLDAERWEGGWVSGITIKTEGVVITAQLDTGEGRAIVNTPFIKNEEIDFGALLEITNQCQQYIHGLRAQTSLFDQEEAA